MTVAAEARTGLLTAEEALEQAGEGRWELVRERSRRCRHLSGTEVSRE